tara:strand:+ start:76 stop:312 length:237 start_codon:yes stop_codon:yes gene_type:complete
MVSAPIFSAFVGATKPREKNLRMGEQAAGFLFLGALGAIGIPALMMLGTKKKEVAQGDRRFNSLQEVEAYLKLKENSN